MTQQTRRGQEEETLPKAGQTIKNVHKANDGSHNQQNTDTLKHVRITILIAIVQKTRCDKPSPSKHMNLTTLLVHSFHADFMFRDNELSVCCTTRQTLHDPLPR